MALFAFIDANALCVLSRLRETSYWLGSTGKKRGRDAGEGRFELASSVALFAFIDANALCAFSRIRGISSGLALLKVGIFASTFINAVVPTCRYTYKK
ncbi:MAG: hypothetical protein APF81_08975 [Desulfosporosinus sp. BRH_c37]|nr:MAG: hypothetical protein APF81_08975 [Desulfosporosinus sp. BRH_c37]